MTTVAWMERLSIRCGKFTVCSFIRSSQSFLNPGSGAEREIPRYQRRGAIIVLGMFALAKREIVIERTETLLRIGLGPHGKVNYVTLSRIVNPIDNE
jgi:hypothetical protein